MIILYQNCAFIILKQKKQIETIAYVQHMHNKGFLEVDHLYVYLGYLCYLHNFFNQTRERLERDMTYTGKPSPHNIQNEGLDYAEVPLDQSDLILKLHHSQRCNKHLKEKQQKIHDGLFKAHEQLKKKNKQIKKLEKSVKNLTENFQKAKEDLTLKLEKKTITCQNLTRKNQALQEKLDFYQAVNEQYQELKMNQLLKKEHTKTHETPMMTDTGSRYQFYFAQQMKKQNHSLKMELEKLREMYKDVLLEFQSQRMIIRNFNKMQMESEDQQFEQITSASQSLSEQIFQSYTIMKKSKRKRRIQRIQRKRNDQQKQSMKQKVREEEKIVQPMPKNFLSGWRSNINGLFSKNWKVSHQMIALFIFVLVLLSLFS